MHRFPRRTDGTSGIMGRGFKEQLRGWRRAVTQPLKNGLRRLKRAGQRIARGLLSPFSGESRRESASAAGSLSPVDAQLLAWFRAGTRPLPAPASPSWQAIPFGEGRLLVAHPLMEFLYIGVDDLRDGPQYVLGKYQERQTVAIEHEIAVGDRVLHLGAQYGFHTLSLAQRVGDTGSVVALEANAARRQRCVENVRAHRLEDRVRVVDCGDEPGALLSLLKREAFAPTIVYVTEGAEIPGPWRHELRESCLEQPKLRVLYGARVVTPDVPEWFAPDAPGDGPEFHRAA